jgi:purine nucleosidase
VLDPSLCDWTTAPLAIDTGGSAAWGATVMDQRRVAIGDAGAAWQIALRVDAERYRMAVRDWLSGSC